ncbi:ribonuclease III [bacterium]|nr:ribonuclease III [bacterium]
MSFRRMNEIEKILGYKFKNLSLLERALTHSSVAENHLQSYQRLEFLGDALLDFIVGEWLFLTRTEATEGELTELRRILVNTEALAKIMKMFSAEKYIKTETSSNSDGVNDSILCDVYESLLAAIYIDGGMKPAKNFVMNTLIANAELLLSSPSFVNYKGELLELTQKYGHQPRYEVLETKGPQHKIVFKVGVYVDKRLLGVGIGHTKKEAEQNASKRALEFLERQSKKNNVNQDN